MAEKKKISTGFKHISLVGFLKENNLEKVTDKDGKNVIRGSIIVSVDDTNSQRVQFYVAEKTKNGDDNASYEKLEKLLPGNTVTIASYLDDNPEANFETASAAASKVWVTAKFEEYAVRKGEREDSKITIKGVSAGFSNPDKPFEPKAEIRIGDGSKQDIPCCYINTITPEKNEEGVETGRLLVELYLPMFDDSVQKLDMIAQTEAGVADYISKNYKVGDTVWLKGKLKAVKVQKVEEPEETFGEPSEPQVRTSFVRETIITGGCPKPIHQGQEGSLSNAFIKSGLAKREIKMTENGIKAKKKQEEKEAEGFGEETAASANVFNNANVTEDDGMDF